MSSLQYLRNEREVKIPRDNDNRVLSNNINIIRKKGNKMSFNLEYSDESKVLFQLTKKEKLIKSLSVKKSAQDLIDNS